MRLGAVSGTVAGPRSPVGAGMELAAIATLLAACAAPAVEVPFAPEPLSVRVDLHAGDALAGPRVPLPAPASDVLGVTVEWTWVEGTLPDLRSVGESARSVVAVGSSAPFVVRAAAIDGLRLALDAAAHDLQAGVAAGSYGRTARGGARTVAVPRGATAVFVALRGAPAVFALHVGRTAEGATRVMLVEPPGWPAAPGAHGVVLSGALAGDRSALALVEGQTAGPSLLWHVVAHHDVSPAAVDESRRALSSAGAAPPATDPSLPRQQVTTEALSLSWTRRRTLLHLATTHGVELLADVALLADAALLAEIAAAVSPGLAAPTASLPWLLECSAVRALVSLEQGRGLPPELGGVAVRHLGEAIRAPGALLAAVERCAGRAEFAAWLQAEHMLALEDAHPAVRARAFDWLEQRQAAPAGFDPLGAKDQRRAALTATGAHRDER